MTRHHFMPSISPAGEFQSSATVGQLAEETGMYSASPEFVRHHGGPLTLQMLDAIPTDWYAQAAELNLYPNIDVRVHRLYPGDYPAVPGWHCDGEYRETYHSQPDLSHVPLHRHLVGTISSHEEGVSLTEFVAEPVTVDINENHPTDGVWQQVHEHITKVNPRTLTAEDGTLYDFSSFTLHRATPTIHRGWRLFLRASMWHKPYLNGEGTLARQEYVYRVSETKGW